MKLLNHTKGRRLQAAESAGIFETLGALLRAMRESKGLNVDDWAELLKTEASTVWRWETNKTIPKYQHLFLIADQGFDPRSFFDQVQRTIGLPTTRGRTT